MELDFPRTRAKRMEISLVPLINVVFLLLIFFLVTGTISKLEIVPITPPVAASGKILDEGHIVITMGAYEEILVDDELVDIEQVIPLVSDKLKSYPDKIITLKADASLPAKKLIEMMDYVKAAGGYNLSLVTQAP